MIALAFQYRMTKNSRADEYLKKNGSRLRPIFSFYAVQKHFRFRHSDFTFL